MNAIVRSKNINFGKPRFVGTRVTLDILLNYIQQGGTLDDFAKDYPSIGKKKAIKALEQLRNTAYKQGVCLGA